MNISPNAEKLFNQALTLPPEARKQFIDTSCGSDQALLREVNSLLTAANEAETYFDNLSGQIGLGALADDIEAETRTKTIGQWRLLRLIGRGGMGAVYLAERADGEYEKQVAIKILPIGLDNESARQRFLTERQILAKLVHDNIARLLDGGVTEEGTPYFVMDYIKGTPINAYCEENELNIKQRLRLVLDVARAVRFAHRNLIIHRDLKPSNVLVEAGGRVQLLDFGVAKVLEPSASQDDLTQIAQRPVTPAYASPEMLRGETVDVTTDVYSLGVLLYQLLTQRLPIQYDGMSLAEVHSHVANTEPAAVSQVNPEVNDDIDAIVAKALSKLPAERYESVESFAQDIRNYLDGLPVTAKTPSSWYRSRKFISRHRAGVSFALLGALGLATIALVAGKAAITSERQSQQIALERDRAEASKDFLISIFDAAGPNRSGADITAREILDTAKSRINSELSDQPQLRSDLLGAMSRVYSTMGLLNEWHAVLFDQLAVNRDYYGERSEQYLDTLIWLSQAEDLTGDYDSSESHANEALAISVSLNNKEGEAKARNRVARILHLKGSYEKAGIEYRKSVALFERELGPDNMDTARAKLNLATLLDHQTHHQEALDLLDEVVATYEKANEKGDNIPTDLYLTKGRILNTLKRHDEAIALYESTIIANNRVYGPDNSYNLYLVNGLGKIAEDTGDYASAILNYTEATRLVTIHIPDSPNAGRANSNIGRAYQLNGECGPAVPAFETALEIFEKQLPEHWFTGEAKWRLGRCLSENKAFTRAEPLILEGLALLNDQWSSKKKLIAEANIAAASLYEAMGQPQQAAKYRRLASDN